MCSSSSLRHSQQGVAASARPPETTMSSGGIRSSSAHGPSDRFRDRRLADAGRTDEEQDVPPELVVVSVPGRARRHALLAQLAHREELEHMIFDILQAVVILLEDLARALQIERLVGPLVPREFRHGLQVGPDDLGLHGIPAGPLEPRELAIHFLLCRLWQRQGLEPGA